MSRAAPLATQPVDAADFKAAMRVLAASVTVITSRRGDQLNGMTATAVCSVSTAPPQILAVVNRETTSHGLIADSGAFAVNILAAHQQELAGRFARRLDRPFEDVAHGLGETGCPLLAEAVAVIECRLRERHHAGTHTIFVGEVVGVSCRGAEPLLYFDGSYRRLAAADGAPPSWR
ncbi:flavin reductase family protein [Xanthobacter aminoxidans]|uniref:flavin reductase family protein n=1 Tax=Xanthobacter aminoxidans TaxID=186280 RepID=UPI00202312E4|nr:flavin reductase family protein [Xanthobacter aminoxidans]MCL8382546.1 flavin reductase family protein [Xanthobacter aminoxidans]